MKINLIRKLEKIVEESDEPRGVFDLLDDAKMAISYYLIIGTVVIGALYIGSKFCKQDEKLASEKNIFEVIYQKTEK